MLRDDGKLRVLIATTNGPVEVLLLTEEDASIGRCVAYIGGTTETADIAAAYHAFVVRPTGIIEGLFGHPCYRLDVSARIDAGTSWQLGVLAAHALHAAGRLAEEHDAADVVLWTTGSVRPVDLTIGAVSHLVEKLASSLDRLKQEAAAGRRVLLALPSQNAAEIDPALASELAAHGIDVLALSRVEPLFGALAMTLPGVPQRVRRVRALGIKAPGATRHPFVWSAAAAMLVSIIAAGTVLRDRYPGIIPIGLAAPKSASLPSPPPSPPIQVERAALVPESVPFISAEDQSRIRDEYMAAPGYKAVATSLSFMTFVASQPDQKSAGAAALAACEQRVSLSRPGLRTVHPCEVYAEGNVVVSRRQRPPMPATPWVIRNPAVERPFVAADLPLVKDEYKERAAKNYLKFARSKAYIVGPTGYPMAFWGESTPEEAIRRSLERCGHDENHACMVIAIDDTFVVAVPTLARAVGFYRPDALTAALPGARDDVARRLANATNGWNAVAVGTGGEAGIKVGAGSEQTAVDGALDECAKRDRDCRVAVIGPFLVEPDPASGTSR